ncbi:MAG: VanZ family protein [Verrucomicrobia bacterium]|nr:VanZ family protein [Verrucomicrobiota bacterium]
MIFVASHRPKLGGGSWFRHSDKVVHFAVYGLLGTLACRPARTWRGAAVAVLVTSAFGASDEWHQSFVPGRTAELADWVADSAGAACAAVLYVRWTWYRRQLERVLPWPTRYGGTTPRAAT